MNKTINITNKKHHMQPKLIGIAVALVACLIGGTVVVGKYLNSKEQTGRVNAKKFYFTSDKLAQEVEGKKLNHYDLPAGTETFTFNLSNNEDNLRETNFNLSVGYVIKVDGEELVEEKDYTATKNSSDDSTKIEINISTLKAGEEHKVIATGYTYEKDDETKTPGYHKTLKATFTILKPEVHKYLATIDNANKNNDCYVLLTVWSEGYTGKINIKFPSNAIPDNTDTLMEAVKSTYSGTDFNDEKTFTNGYDSHTYRFFVTNPASINESDFTVTYYDSTNNVLGTADTMNPIETAKTSGKSTNSSNGQ